MTQYYLDIETTGLNPQKDKIISIQYQKIYNNGNPLGQLNILKEWESSEKEIVEKFYKEFMQDNVWDFVPIMNNSIFDLTFLFSKFKQYNLECPELSNYLYQKPLVDIKYILIMCNGLIFKGAGLDKITNKKDEGRMVAEWYRLQDYDAIESYVTQETESFLEFFRKCMEEFQKLKK